MFNEITALKVSLGNATYLPKQEGRTVFHDDAALPGTPNSADVLGQSPDALDNSTNASTSAQDTASVSDHAKEMAAADRAKGPAGQTDNKSPDGLTSQQRQQVTKLRQRDTEVRAHEQAHAAAAGQYAGAIHLEYTQGPDHQLYAVNGEVSIDSSPVPNDPQATITKMKVIERAAMAPAQPSGQDQAVLSAALQTEMQAQAALSQQQTQKIRQALDGNVAQQNSTQNSKRAMEAYRKSVPEKRGIAKG